MWWVVTAALEVGVAVCYLLVASTILRGLLRTADARAEQRRAVEIHDDVVQSLTAVLYALELGEPEVAAEAAERGLAAARQSLGQGTTRAGIGLEPGDLRRGHPAVGSR